MKLPFAKSPSEIKHHCLQSSFIHGEIEWPHFAVVTGLQQLTFFSQNVEQTWGET
jgi:hypothetical protein